MRRRKKKSDFKLIHSGCGEVLLLFTPRNFDFKLDEYEREERNSIFQKYTEPEPVIIPPDVKKICVEKDLVRGPTELMLFYLEIMTETETKDNTVRISNKDTANKLMCSTRSVERWRKILIENGYISAEYDRKNKHHIIKLLQRHV